MAVRCWALLLALASCSPEPAPPEAKTAWTYAPAAVGFVPAPIARIGRSQAPQLAAVRGIAGAVTAPLRSATPTAVPGKPLAVLYGLDGAKSAIDLVDIDAGRVLWRDATACAGPVVGATEDAIVCADANGVRAVGMDGKQKWKIEAAFLAFTGERVVVEEAGEAVVHDASSGDELTRVKLPASVTGDAVLASCGDAGRELFAQGQDGRLVRIADAKGGSAITWGVPIGKIDELDACEGTTVLVREAGAFGGSLVAIDRASGKITGRIEGVRGHWKARDGSERLEVSTTIGLATWPRDLTGGPQITLPLVLGELIDQRGALRLVRATEGSAVVLDAAGVRAYVPFAAMSGVIGETAIVRASWGGDDLPRRVALPERYARALRLVSARTGVALPAELRDLPPVLPPASTIDKPDTAAFGVVDIVVAGPTLYALALEKSNEETNTAGIAAIDLASRAARWQRPDACGTGEALRLALARDVIICASRTRTTPSALVRATSLDGASRWEHERDHVTDIAAAGDAVLVFDGDTITVLDAATGKARYRITSSDGARAIAAAVSVDAATYVVAAERGHVVARTLGGWPLWSIGVDGVVRSIEAAGTGAVVTLEDGDAYRIELPTGEVFALPGIGLSWQAAGDVLVAQTAGGPIPGQPEPPPLRVLKPILEKKKKKEPDPDVDPERPKLWDPIQPPPPLGDSVQVTLFEPTGGLRARNDYALLGGVVARARGAAGSPVILVAGRDLLVLDPHTGDPKRRVQLAEDGLAFATIVDGVPVTGAVLAAPLRVVIF